MLPCSTVNKKLNDFTYYIGYNKIIFVKNKRKNTHEIDKATDRHFGMRGNIRLR